MQMPGFWHAGPLSVLARLLSPLGWLYGRQTISRLARPGIRVPIPVISIGNFTAGGAGKTPTTIALVQDLLARGERVFVISRGYGGRKKGPVLVDPAIHDFHDVGDEPLLIARFCPVIVARNRAAGARLAIAEGAGVIVLDDALQNPDLVKDFSLVVVDGGFGVGNGECVPAGPLRAPVRAMLAHVSAVLIIGRDEHDIAGGMAGMQISTAIMQPDAAVAAALHNRDIIAYCGIGRPEKFHATLRSIGAILRNHHDFGDHHAFTDAEAHMMLGEAQSSGAQLVTTQKDFIRLKGSDALDALRMASIAVPISLTLDPALLTQIYAALDSCRKRSSTASGLE